MNGCAAFSMAANAFMAIFAVRGFVRRHPRARVGALHPGWTLALLYGVIVLILAAMVAWGSPATAHDDLLVLAAVLLFGALPVAVVGSLSRPAAKAWFASAPADARSARR